MINLINIVDSDDVKTNSGIILRGKIVKFCRSFSEEFNKNN